MKPLPFTAYHNGPTHTPEHAAFLAALALASLLAGHLDPTMPPPCARIHASLARCDATCRAMPDDYEAMACHDACADLHSAAFTDTCNPEVTP